MELNVRHKPIHACTRRGRRRRLCENIDCTCVAFTAPASHVVKPRKGAGETRKTHLHSRAHSRIYAIAFAFARAFTPERTRSFRSSENAVSHLGCTWE